ncbi:MAG: hypothetical protein FWF57_10250 [Defluviitaleaceae bacterium]|nr:hypothetical protein [Defluviitaleaceae bacterium]
MKKIIKAFTAVYLYELEKYLQTKKNEILKISLWQDEANTDRPLKEYLKKLIEHSFNKLPVNTDIVRVVFDNSENTNIDDINKFEIANVLLPEEITPNIKNLIYNEKDGVYTKPDLCLEIILNGIKYYETIELKTTKTDAIPGSSIQQITPNEWVVFVKFSKDNNIDITTGQYINAINSKMQFPDRSPRPQVSFNEIKKWNLLYRSNKNGVLEFKEDKNSLIKYELLSDWQDVLSKRWVDILLNANSLKSNEPWFNNALRKFIIEFLKEYDELPTSEKLALKNKIKLLIEN